MWSIEILRCHSVSTEHVHPGPALVLRQSQTSRRTVNVRSDLTEDQMLSGGRTKRLRGAEHLLPDAQQPGDAVIGDASGGPQRQETRSRLRGLLVVCLRGVLLLVMMVGGVYWGFGFRRGLDGTHEFWPFLH